MWILFYSFVCEALFTIINVEKPFLSGIFMLILRHGHKIQILTLTLLFDQMKALVGD